MKVVSIIAFIGVLIGAIVWLLVGLFSFNPVTFILGAGIVSRIIYAIVGFSALWLIFAWAVKRPVIDM